MSINYDDKMNRMLTLCMGGDLCGPIVILLTNMVEVH